jgi:neutral ceramidase
MRIPFFLFVTVSTLLSCSKDKDGSSVPAEDPSEPGELRVGKAQMRMPVPLGIGTVGYGGFTEGGQYPPSPFAEKYPATTRIHNHPDFRAIAISRGEGFEVVFLRIDTVGVFQQLRRGVLLEVEDRTGIDLQDALIIGATHTHSGPGRVIDAEGPFELIADTFFPEFYDRMVDGMADVVVAAMDDLKPGRVGYTIADSTDGIADRRCEDGQIYENGTLPILAIEQEGQLSAVMLAYPPHGTLLALSDLSISQDVSGGIEQAIADRFDHPVQVQMMNSWGADMAPGSPSIALDLGAELPDGYQRMEEIGSVVADTVADAIGDLSWSDAPDMVMETHRVAIDREVIGYDDATFTYDYGAVYCGSGLDADCDVSTTYQPELDDACIPFSDLFPAPTTTEFTAGRIGDLHLITFPGESGTLLAEQVVEGIRAYSGVEDVVYLGYSQDYLGYSILEEDWWNGGYEASGALWGPRQGAYLAEAAVQVFGRTFGFNPMAPEPDPVAPFGSSDFAPYVAPTAVDFGEVLVDVASSYGPTEVLTFTVAGADPWFTAPVAWLEEASGEPVLRAGGIPLNSDGQAFWTDLAVDPTYDEELSPTARQFQWTFNLPIRHQVPGAVPALSGEYQLRVELPDGAGGLVSVTSAVFSVDATEG